jgi:ElaB/YqjD/DUF883 family membrane-anchored ribosome-binding protein
MTPSLNTTHSAHRRGDGSAQFDANALLALLGRDLRQVEEQLATVGASVSSPLTENISEAAEELRQSVSAFLEKTRGATGAIVEQAQEKSEALHEQMERHPIAAASSAFALGYFLGRTVFRHKQHAANS